MSDNTIDSRLTNLTPTQLALLKLKLEKKKELIKNVNYSNSIPQKSSQSNFSDAYTQFRRWQNQFQYGRSTWIDRNLVHKDKEENVLISHLEKLHEDLIIGEVLQNLSHSFFYEHPKDHIPGLYILEAARQFGTALSHLYYDLPLGTSFILNNLQAQFHHFAETSIPLFVMARISDKVYVNNKLFHLDSRVLFVQNEQIIAEVNGNFKIFEITSYNNIRKNTTRNHSSLLEINT
ncbi:MAG: AfsA-related hotdog domain-containing protein [Nostoc sp.]|uniref:AfsA-related hotdog domain-containing protein n=1 Tax=Nostoc sp. TaxID=1180 RepID=UPI002FF4C266